MKKLILLSGLLLLASLTWAQKKQGYNSLEQWLEQIYAQKQTENLKSYYTDRSTADTCEAWYSCAKWAFEQYTQDQSFKITRAKLKTKRKMYRHRVVKENHLFVEATYQNKTVYLEFMTPKASGRTAAYKRIARFPK